MRRILSLLLLATTTLLTACVSDDGPTAQFVGDADGGMDVAREHAYTILTEVTFDGETQPAGFTVEFAPLPLGIEDERPYPVGTVLVQDSALENLGFITPRGRAFAFDTDGNSHDRGFGKREAQIATLLGRTSGVLRLRRVSPLDG